ncbi:MAG: hypothetical protein RR306_06735 [Clostridia bacterium]
MATKIQLKRGLSANLDAATLLVGEPALVTDTGKLYIGDGTQKVLINPIDKPASIDTTTTHTKFKLNEYGQVIAVSEVTADDIPNIPASKVTGLGTAALLNVGESNGNVPVIGVDGKLATSILPSIAVTDTFVVASETEMLALKAEIGDIAIRSDIKQTFILKTMPATVKENWVQFATPTDSVTSVNGLKNDVILTGKEIILTGYTLPATTADVVSTDSTSVAIGKLEKGLSLKAPSLSPIFTGTPTAPTAAKTDSSTTIATTAFVHSLTDVIDGGTF